MGGRRAGDRGSHARPFRAGTAGLARPLLLPLFLVRTVRQVLHKRRHRREFLAALPYITCFTLSWSLGELIGYVFGPGDSQAQIE